MAASRRIQFLTDAEELRQRRAVSRRRKTSAGELIRGAAREFYFTPPTDRRLLVDAILGLNLPNIAWRKAKTEIVVAPAGLHRRETSPRRYGGCFTQRFVPAVLSISAARASTFPGVLQPSST